MGHAILMLTHEPSLLPGPQIKEIGGEQRRKLLPNLSDEQHLDIDLFLSHFPDVEITFEAHVEDENDVQANASTAWGRRAHAPHNPHFSNYMHPNHLSVTIRLKRVISQISCS